MLVKKGGVINDIKACVPKAGIGEDAGASTRIIDKRDRFDGFIRFEKIRSIIEIAVILYLIKLDVIISCSGNFVNQ